ncbi:MAG: hypothetical protein SVR81_08200 [Chloroflexota bacterium]|nr:hypothetical protein [Chloroflexota bacterium]
MILFLIELYLFGCTLAIFFRDKLSDFLLSVFAVLFGFLGYFINVLVLTLVGVSVSAGLLSILIAMEIVLLFMLHWIRMKALLFDFRISNLWFLAVGVLYVLACWAFLRYPFVFYSPDSLYMVIVGRSILETGFSQWYFASPLLWGVLTPILQTLGMLFGYDYTWFVHPVLSLTFLIIFSALIVRAAKPLTSRKAMPFLLAGLGAGLMLTANMYWVAQFYVHNNFVSGMSLFLIVTSLYFAMRGEADGWLGIAGIFLIPFGMARTENVIVASVVILLTIASRKIAHNKLVWTFLPYLVFQIVWNLVVLRIDPVAFSNLMTTDQLRLVTIALVALVGFVLLSDLPWVRKQVLPRTNRLLALAILFLFVVVFALNPSRMFINTWQNFISMFATGKWLMTFWGTWFLMLLVKPHERRSTDKFFDLLIFSFFSMIVILGAVKGGYHRFWYDSANRMYIHILPIMTFYLMLRIGRRFSDQESGILTLAEE